jgi:hypothetical protein
MRADHKDTGCLQRSRQRAQDAVIAADKGGQSLGQERQQRQARLELADLRTSADAARHHHMGNAMALENSRQRCEVLEVQFLVVP